MSLNKKIISIVAFACLLVAAISISGFLFFNKKEKENGIIKKERTIHAQLAAATKYVASQGGLKDVIQKFQNKYSSASQLNDDEKKEILNQVPIYAAMVIGKENQTKDNYEFRVFSNEPRKKENQATATEMEIFKKFESDSSLEELIDVDGTKVTVFKPVRLSESQGCLTCHGNPSTSPWKNGTDILGYKMEDWKDGKLHGVFAVTENSEAKTAGAGSIIFSPSGFLIGAIALGALFSLLFSYLLMKDSIQALVKASQNLLNVSTQVNASAGDVAGNSQDIAMAATQQAASLAETATSLEEITSMIAKASDNANSTAEGSAESMHKAEQGKHTVDQMLSSMEEISQSNEAILNQINQSNQQMEEIVKVIEEIGNRTKVINEIVFQTKLLSFNASVEAARAGDHGKGFAVVAEEVGNLAQMSGNAAQEISDMLQASITRVENIIRDTQQKVEGLVQNGKVKVENGVNVAKQCSDTLTEIVKDVTQVSDLSKEISQATKEQSLGVSEINKAMSQLDSVTQQNAASSEKAASSADQLSNQAIALKNSIDDLLKVINGNTTDTLPVVSTPPTTETHVKVIPLKQKKTNLTKAENTSLKKAANFDSGTPYRNSSGFEDT